MVEKKSLKNLKDGTKWNRIIGGRTFNITSGAFGDTLPIRGQYWIGVPLNNVGGETFCDLQTLLHTFF